MDLQNIKNVKDLMKMITLAIILLKTQFRENRIH